MSNVLVNDEYLKAIGDAIREKNGTVLKYKPSEMAGQIKNISSGSSSTDFSSIFNFKNVTIDPALHAKSFKISLLDGENGSNIINNEEVGLAKSSFKIDATIEDGYLPSNIYTAKVNSVNDLEISGEASTAPPQFPSKYLFAKQNFNGTPSTHHIDLTNDKLFASMDLATAGIKINFKSDVSISNLTFNNKKKLTATLLIHEDNHTKIYQAIGKATFDAINKCINIDLGENGYANYSAFFDQNLTLLNLYLKDSDFIRLNEEMKIIDIEGKPKFFYFIGKDLPDDQTFELLDNTFSSENFSNAKYLFEINPVSKSCYGLIYSELDNKCISISSEFFNPNKYYNEGAKTFYRMYRYFSNYNSTTEYYALNNNITFDVLYNEFLSMHNSWFNNNSWYKTSYKEKYDKLEETITALKNKTDSEKQTLIDNAKTNFTQYYNYSYNYYFNGRNGYTDDEVSKIFSSIIYSKGMYTLKNPPKMKIAFEVDV